jgi:hypothetical protein
MKKIIVRSNFINLAPTTQPIAEDITRHQISQTPLFSCGSTPFLVSYKIAEKDKHTHIGADFVNVLNTTTTPRLTITAVDSVPGKWVIYHITARDDRMLGFDFDINKANP